MTAQPTELAVYKSDNAALSKHRYEPEDLRSLCEYAQLVVKSGLAPKYVKKWQDAVVIMKRGAELGLATQTALESMFVIGGKTSMYADLAVGLVKGRGHRFVVVESTGARAIVKTVRRGYEDDGETYSSGRPFEYTMEMAKKAGWTSNKMYQKIPRNMLLARAKMELARMVYEDLLAGIYDPTEVLDMGSAEVVHEVARHYGDRDTAQAVEAEFEEESSEPTLSEGAAKQRLLSAIETTLGLAEESAREHALQVWIDAGLAAPVLESDLQRVIANLDATDAAVNEPANDPDEVFPLSSAERQHIYKRIFAQLNETGRTKDEIDQARYCWMSAKHEANSLNDLTDDQVRHLDQLVREMSDQELDAWVAEWAEIAAQAEREAG